MSTAPRTVYEAVSGEAHRVREEWIALKNSIKEAARLGDHEIQEEKLEMIDREFEEAVRSLHEALSRPKLILAVAGVTSSGKSSFLNFLLETELLPSGTLALTAGCTRIVDAPEPSGWIQHSTGETEALPVEDTARARERLRTLFYDYDDAKKAASEAGKTVPQAPFVEISLPLQPLAAPSRLDLPDFVELELLDLPGREAVIDKVNGPIIEEHVKNSLGILLYNAEQAVQGAEEKLLEEIAQRAYDMRCSPAKLLFVLNRIDALCRDNWTPERFGQFVAEKTRGIRKVLREKFRGFEKEIEQVTVLPFSSEVALYARLLTKLQGEDRVRVARLLDEHYNSLFPTDLKDELPRNPAKWSDAQVSALSAALWDRSGAQRMLRHLRRHIALHLPEVVIPPVLNRYWKDQSSEARSWAVNVTQAILTSASQDYESQIKELEGKRRRVEEVISNHQHKLSEFISRLREELRKRQDPSCKDEAKPVSAILHNLYGKEILERMSQRQSIEDWFNRIAAIQGSLNDALAAAFRDGDFTLLRKFAAEGRCGCDQIIETIAFLRNNYGGDSLLRKKMIEARADQKPNPVETFTREMKRLAGDLGALTNHHTNHVLLSEQNTIKDAVTFFTTFVVDRINEEVREITSDFLLSLPSAPAGDTAKFELRLELHDKFDTWEEPRTETVERPPRDLWEHVTSWFGARYFEQRGFKMVVYEFAGIEKFMNEEWGKQIEWYLKEAAEKFQKYIQREVGSHINAAKAKLDDEFKNYRSLIEQNKSRCTEAYEKIRSRWEPVRRLAGQFDQKAEAVGAGFCEAESLAGEWRNDKDDSLFLNADGSWSLRTAQGIEEGRWEFESPLLWLADGNSSKERHPWMGQLGRYLMPASDRENKFCKVQPEDADAETQ